jgi:hypothetical protein
MKSLEPFSQISKEGQTPGQPDQWFAQHIAKHVEDSYDPELAQIWSERELSDLTIEEYAQRIKERGSGHFLIHCAKREFLDLVLRKGYFAPTLAAYAFAKAEEDPEAQEYRSHNYLVASSALHFSADEPYLQNSAIGFVTSIEAILENKSFMSIPLDFVGEKGTNNDMTVSGKIENPNDESNKFFVDSLGILFIPKSQRGYMRVFKNTERMATENWNEEETPTISIEEFILDLRERGLPVPKRIYFYDGNSIKDGFQQFLVEYGLTIPPPKKKISVSAKITPSYKRGSSYFHYSPSGEGEYFSIKK